LATLANQLVELKVDVIVAMNTPSVQAAKKATATTPIVMMRVADPVKSGIVPNLSRPGGNITGLSFMVDELSGKRFSLLKEALPSVARVAVVWFAPNSGSDITVRAMKASTQALGLELLQLPVHAPDELIGAFQAATHGRVGAVFVIEDSVATRHRVEILNLAARYSLPVVSQYNTFAEAGALIAYGPSLPAMYARAVSYVDRILKGATAGELPVEQPTKFDLVINLKTAKALGLTIPPALLAQADEVIE
jgi:putative ABC transport system substrate-binding protein